jgi:hypothetical protein
MDYRAVRGGAQRAMTRLALLPLDDRPVNYDHPWWLGRAAGIDVVRPPRDWLGSPLRSAARERLADWLRDEAASVDGLVVAIDTLGYGGLIPSRQSTAAVEDVVTALEPLRAIRAARPSTPILAFSILMRVNRSNSAEEEKAYCATYGADLFRLSYLDDKMGRGDADDGETAERDQLAAWVPSEIVADYRAGRARNHRINQLMLEWAGEGVVDYALIGQDDTAPYGWNIAEARELRRLIERDGLAARASVYPGADEVGSLLIAAFACRQAHFAPRVWSRYSGVDGAFAITAYEDRPFGELIKAHLGPLGGSLAGSPDDADLVLAVNAPGVAQAEAWLQLAVRDPTRPVVRERGGAIDAAAVSRVMREMTTIRRDADELARSVAADIAAGRMVAVVDVAFVNGADLAFAEDLIARVPLARLAAYAAWNTAGNSLGSALAQGVVRAITCRKEQPVGVLGAHLTLLLIHFLDDYVYQGVVRTELLLDDLPSLGLGISFERLPDGVLSEVEARLGRRFAPYVESLGERFAADSIANGPTTWRVTTSTIEPPTLPWQRAFEVAITPRIEMAITPNANLA